ncbi:unnamed protein product [Allacma fusca]|uniref:Deoxyribodipyrimidine photo-lyase n=1 Tax=Allacma fusca TaxID=39272 RepID=A0A8J2JKV9_9HEXA|nr:unnamed protein product [Allacma fusca]
MASSPKKTKTSDNNILEFSDKIHEQRLQLAKSPAEFKFEKSRCRMLTKEENLPANHRGILYWMSRDQRVQDNWAMIYAQRLAIAEKVPLIVCFCLVPKFLEATLRQYGFMLRGLSLVREELCKLKIPFHLFFGDAKKTIPEFVTKHNIGGVVTDFAPLRVPRLWVKQVGDKLPEDVPFCQVDAHNIVPLWVTSSKQEHAARTIRPKINNNLPKYLTEFPPVTQHPFKDASMKCQNPFENWDKLINFLEINKSVKEVEWAKPGYEESLKVLKSFIDDRLKNFEHKRNDPNVNALSNLSPWFHFGQISVARAVLEVKKSSHKSAAAVFIEEAVVRRELSDNFCYYNDNYDSLDGALDWARTSLNLHKKDKRPRLYKLKEFEGANTYDDLWNAAQIQLNLEGKMHGFLRMYWAKKILEWSESPEKALEIAIYLNDKYNIDGRDPNGYVGCMWSICGIHDQGWREREVFGKIRYMNYEGCKRKFDVDGFVFKYKRLAKTTADAKKEDKGSPPTSKKETEEGSTSKSKSVAGSSSNSRKGTR